MKKNIIIIVLAVMCVTFGFLAFNKEKVEDGFNDLSQIKHKTMLSMMLEQNAGEGDYELETRSSWPTEEDGYVFNLTLSKCENGSQLRWDGENNMVVMVGTTSDNCYVYFDVYVEPSVTLADYVKSLYTGTQGGNNLYYHDSTLTNGAGDNSYRYAGSSDTTNNYVCFGSDAESCPDDNLYRIIGVFGDQVKLIKWDYANSDLLGKDGKYKSSCEETTYCGGTYGPSKGSNTELQIGAYFWGGNNFWESSLLNTVNLNVNYINYFNNQSEKWIEMIADTSWVIGGSTFSNIASTSVSNTFNNEIASQVMDSENMYLAKLGLMYVSDYGYAAPPSAWTTNLNSYKSNSIVTVNWLYMGLYEWTITRQSENNSDVFYIDSYGDISYSTVINSGAAWTVRPVFYLKNDITYASGTGTKEDSIRIN